MKVGKILQSKGAEVFSVSEENSLAEAVDVLTERNIGAVVVKNRAGAVVGILSERDIVRRLKREGAAALDAKVADCMTAKPHTCTPDHTIDDLMGVMTAKRIRHIPVVNGDKMVGLVSIGDIVKRKIEETELEAAALKQYISS